MNLNIFFKKHVKNYTLKLRFVCVLFLALLIYGCVPNKTDWENITEEGSFLIFRRQSQIGKETYSITSNKDSIIVTSIQGENERGRITGVQSVLHLNMDLSPRYYINRRIKKNDTVVNFKMSVAKNKISFWEKRFEVVNAETTSAFYPVHSNISAATEMMLYHYYFEKGKPKSILTFPRGEISITHSGQDIVQIKEGKKVLERYVVKGINWGGRTIWINQDNKLVALVKANTQIREIIRKGYEDALPTFIAGNVIEQMNTLDRYTNENKVEQSKITALVGGDIVDGLSDVTKKNMTLIIEDGRIKKIGPLSEIEIPENAKIIDVTGKTLIPGLWDMHAHSNQVQWAPAYLAGGITTIRDNGNEIEFATAFRDAIDLNGALGPDILLAGMTDGAGVRGNGIIRATSEEQAREVVAMYHEYGYRQIKIYQSLEPEIIKVLVEEAHRRGMTVTGHVPTKVENAITAIELGMDQLSHSGQFLSLLFPDKKLSDMGRNYLNNHNVSSDQIKKATDFLLKHKTVLDPTIALLVVRAVQSGMPVESVEPDAYRIAYELFEGKRFRSGMSAINSEKAIGGYTKQMEIIGEFHRAGVPIVAGTDNVIPVYSLYLEIETYHRLAGLTALEAIKTATINSAKAMGLDSETGTLEIGKEADIAILNKNPLDNISNIRTVTAVVTNGNYYKSNPLWEAANFQQTKN
tara:strand:+ start:10614 stop:12692 length:2079 start_codon:yes stop_codon:yes gene_type:complete